MQEENEHTKDAMPTVQEVARFFAVNDSQLSSIALIFSLSIFSIF